MKSIIFILCPIFAFIVQTSGKNFLWDLLTKPPTEIPNICNSMPDWSFVADPHDCRKFYGCVYNVSEHFECAENNYFDSMTLQCIPGNCNECHSSEVLPVKNECHKFTFCRAGYSEIHQCSKNHYFDIEMSICRPKHNSPDAQCRCGDVADNHIFPNPEDCETYYTCKNEKAVLIQCPKGEYFDTEIKSCLPDVHGICLQRPTLPPGPPTSDEFCNTSDVDGTIFFSSPTDCKTFFICVKGELLIERCPENFYFDDELRYCRREHKGFICKKRDFVIDQIKKNLLTAIKI